MNNDKLLLNNDNKKEPKNSPAKLKAIHKYDKSHYKTIASKIKIENYAQILKYSEDNNISISKLCKLCIDYCMAHGVRFGDSDDI